MNITEILFTFAPYTPFISFGLLMLAGMNLPIPEEVVVIVSSSIASTIIPHQTVNIYIGCWLGVYFSDIMVYLIGRYFGRRLIRTKVGSRILPMDKVEKVSGYFSKYGILTLLFGRLVPFGFRNILFSTAGIAKMSIGKFLIIDVIPLSITTSVYFYLGYLLGENYEKIYPYLDRVKFIILGIFLSIVSLVIVRSILKKNSTKIVKD
jgi:membrane-associated protein